MKQTVAKWEEISKKVVDMKNVPELVYENSGIIKRILIDLIDQDITRIIVNSEKEKQSLENMLKENEQTIDIVLKKQDSLLDLYDLSSQLEKIENRKIWLKCGGFITIDKTEALTAIDVNSGKYIGTKSLEQTVYTVNKEASIEIAKQLRLRDIGGIIIIDYIDMKEKEHKEKIIGVLQENLKNDRSKTQIVGFTELNLLEMTRKHMCSND
jgi:ribonuclease G